MKTPSELIDDLVPTALFGIAGDDTPEQQDWAAAILDAAVLIMDKYPYEGKMTLTRDQIKMNAEGCRRRAEELRRAETLPDDLTVFG